MGDKRIGLRGVLVQACQFGIRKTIDSLWVGEGFGKTLPGEAEEYQSHYLVLSWPEHLR
jgi:hypothetical protein